MSNFGESARHSSRLAPRPAVYALGVALFLAVFNGLTGCGPLNEKRSDAAGSVAAGARCSGLPGDAADTDESLPLSVSDGHRFIFSVQPSNIRPGSETGTKMVDITLRVVHGADLRAINKEAQITVQYLHVNTNGNGTHDPYPLTVTRADDGSYLGTITYKRGGNFDFTITLSDGQEQDEIRKNKIRLHI